MNKYCKIIIHNDDHFCLIILVKRIQVWNGKKKICKENLEIIRIFIRVNKLM